MLDERLLREEVYAIHLDGQTLFYAPLTRFFTVYDGIITLEDVDEEWLKEASDMKNVPDFIRNKGFVFDKEKIRLRLNITTGCNLECRYCSVRADSGPVTDMPEVIAKNAIDGFCKFAEETGAKFLEIVYSGGEPTLRTPFIEKTIAYARSRLGAKTELIPRLLTNGLFSRKKFTRIIGDMKEVQVSWDGFGDKNLRYGGNAQIARRVWGNIGFLLENNVPMSVLVVVSESNSGHLREIVDEMYTYGVKHIFLSLKENLGRALGGKSTVDYAALGKAYFELWKDYRAKGMDINLTGTDIHSVSPFPCSVPIPNYSVSPDGTISACTISFNDKSAFAKSFEIGMVTDRGVTIRDESVESVRQFHVLNMPGCATCFAKWHCRGGCVYSKNGDWFSSFPVDRCAMIRDIIAHKLHTIITEQ